jgi:hypothetical protein
VPNTIIGQRRRPAASLPRRIESRAGHVITLSFVLMKDDWCPGCPTRNKGGNQKSEVQNDGI